MFKKRNKYIFYGILGRDAISLILLINISYIKFGEIPPNKCWLLQQSWKKKQIKVLAITIYVKVQVNIKFYEMMYKILHWSVHRTSVTHRKHFPKIIKTILGHLKTSKAIKNQEQRDFTNPIFTFYEYIGKRYLFSLRI